jgi:hypothetical protein
MAPQSASRAVLHARLIKLERLLRTECVATEALQHGRAIRREHCYWCEAAADARDAAKALAPTRLKRPATRGRATAAQQQQKTGRA